MTPPPLLVGGPEVAAFLLANAIIIFFCAPRFVLDLKRWRS